MKMLRPLGLILILFNVFARAETEFSIPTSPPKGGGTMSGEDGPVFRFTTQDDGIAKVKAMFFIMWISGRRENVISNPKATRFILDGTSYPRIAGEENFHGYMDETLWPERFVRTNQTVWIEETIPLPKGAHTIQFQNGLMERDDSGIRTQYSSAGWQTATLTWGASESAGLKIQISILPETIKTDGFAVVTWSSNGKSALVKGDGLNSSLLSGNQSVQGLAAGIHTYTITGTASDGSTKTATATLTVQSASEDPILKPLAPTASIEPKTQTITLGTTAKLVLSSTGASQGAIVGTDGFSDINPPATVVIKPPALGQYQYNYTTRGHVNITWVIFGADQVFIDPPSGPSIDVTNLLSLDVDQGGNYALRQIVGGTTSSRPFVVTIPESSDTASVTVTQIGGPVADAGPRVTEFSPTEANYTVTTGPAAGHTYKRSWQDGAAWSAYLGRSGVAFHLVGTSPSGPVASFEIQAKPPGADWHLLASSTPSAEAPNGAGVAVASTTSAQLGEVMPDQPLIPSNRALVGTWQMRARVSDTAGQWSPWAFEQPLNVILPLTVVQKTGQTLPPEEDKEWFTASAVETYTFNVWIP